MTARLSEIESWLTALYPDKVLESCTYLESDASARKYLRCILNDKPYIVMDTTPGQEQVNFIKIAKILFAKGINVPEIIANDFEQGLILMSDFGDQTYLSVLNTASYQDANILYTYAIATITKIQGISKEQHQLPTMDESYVDQMLDIFNIWYLQKHLNVIQDTATGNLLRAMHALFTNAFKELPQVFVHIDYHSRNIMHTSENSNPGILDFQDAMFGPMTYDLASLFQDAYIAWPRELVENWVKDYYNIAVKDGLIKHQTFEAVLRNFDIVGMQRHIKNLGIFARLNYRDNKAKYLDSMPTLLDYVEETCRRYPELLSIHQLLNEHIILTENIIVA